jgi:hypothetical protein
METEYPKILGSREQSSMASTWTEYLRLSKPHKNSPLLEICMYEGLGEQKWNEDGEPAELPDKINGKKVVGVDDGIIVGGALGCYSDDDSLSFTKHTLPDAISWLASHKWKSSDELLPEITKAVIIG